MSSSYWYKNDDLVILTHKDLKQDDRSPEVLIDLTRHVEELREECDELHIRIENNEVATGTLATAVGILTNTNTQSTQCIEELKQSLRLAEQMLIDQSIRISKLEKDWTQTTNRLLEAETNLERTKNILVRKHISFPFISDMKL